jgi:hypothetical protein
MTEKAFIGLQDLKNFPIEALPQFQEGFDYPISFNDILMFRGERVVIEDIYLPNGVVDQYVVPIGKTFFILSATLSCYFDQDNGGEVSCIYIGADAIDKKRILTIQGSDSPPINPSMNCTNTLNFNIPLKVLEDEHIYTEIASFATVSFNVVGYLIDNIYLKV